MRCNRRPVFSSPPLLSLSPFLNQLFFASRCFISVEKFRAERHCHASRTSFSHLHLAPYAYVQMEETWKRVQVRSKASSAWRV